MKLRVYVETSVISYLTARPSRDLSVAARQQSSLELWDSQDRYELVVSDLVLAEASAGDAQAAASRRAWLTGLFILPIDSDAQGIADALVAKGAMPAAAFADALHIGIAASHQIEVIASWIFVISPVCGRAAVLRQRCKNWAMVHAISRHPMN